MSAPLERRLWWAARKRATARGIPFEIDVADIVIPTHCPILGIPLKPMSGRGAVPIPERNNSPSLDRIDNAKGYVKGNVAVISMRANHIKADGTADELIAIAEFMKAHQAKISAAKSA